MVTFLWGQLSAAEEQAAGASKTQPSAVMANKEFSQFQLKTPTQPRFGGAGGVPVVSILFLITGPSLYPSAHDGNSVRFWDGVSLSGKKWFRFCQVRPRNRETTYRSGAASSVANRFRTKLTRCAERRKIVF